MQMPCARVRFLTRLHISQAKEHSHILEIAPNYSYTHKLLTFAYIQTYQALLQDGPFQAKSE
jgi:hypothetical protein